MDTDQLKDVKIHFKSVLIYATFEQHLLINSFADHIMIEILGY